MLIKGLPTDLSKPHIIVAYGVEVAEIAELLQQVDDIDTEGTMLRFAILRIRNPDAILEFIPLEMSD